MNLDLLSGIVAIFAFSTLVNFLFSKIKIPTILGYLLTGIIVGPSMLGIVGDSHEIELIAEIGVVMLLFSIGIEFSLNHLLKIRKIVFLGGFLQLVFTVAVTMFIARGYNVDWKGALFIGFITALSSTAVVLKILQERSEVTSNYGRTVLGILIFQDLLLVPLLLFTPILGGENGDVNSSLLLLGIKAILIIGFIYFGNRWLMPRLLHAIARTKNQELFLMSILFICLGVAFLTAKLGMSLAFGAFLAGLMISDTQYSHNAFGNLAPLKDLFVSFFFISIGILLDISFVIDQPFLVFFTVVIVIFFKAVMASGTAFLLGHTFRGTIMVGFALSQVGEFSFVLASMGRDFELLSPFHYQLFLAVAVISMALTPLLMRISRPLSNLLLKLPLPKKVVDGIFPLPQIDIPDLRGHIVIIGKDSRALNLARMTRSMDLPYIAIIFDPEEVRRRQLKGERVLYGDAINEPILKKAHVDKSDTVVISIGNVITAMAVIEKVRNMNPHTFIIVRTKKVEDIEDLYSVGASKVIPEEFETSIELFDRLLAKMLIPRREINSLINRIRNDNYGIFLDKVVKSDLSVLKELANIEITAVRVDDRSPVIGKSLVEMELRNKYGVTIAALLRKKDLMDNPDPETLIEKGDLVYLMGRPEQITYASELFERKRAQSDNFVEN
ncbi:MAG TPA: cation:proton antiporter [Bacteroidales bacterium]|nr:cation:proton antiporter [Bacteroidales bacterium]